jgi:hypothetical protein
VMAARDFLNGARLQVGAKLGRRQGSES